MNGTFIFALTFAVASGDSAPFQEWVEKEYLSALQETNCFFVGYKKLVDLESFDEKHMEVIRYTLTPKDENHWAIFKDSYKQELHKKFTEKWAHLWKTNKLICRQIAGLEDERGTVMITPNYRVSS